jgi:GMP synthase (glutamine-hydrolysing)
MKKLFIIKTGSAFPETAARHGDFEDMIKKGLACRDAEVSTIDACQGESLPAPQECQGVVITGAHCMVTDNLPWSLAIEAWLPELVRQQVPLLGICYGHQLLGRAMGGQVDFHPRGREVGTVEIKKTAAAQTDPLFKELPEYFPVHTTHSQSVLTLPPGAILLAENDFEPHHAFRIGHCAWGVQFHPEYNLDFMRDYLYKQQEALTEAGQDVARLAGGICATPAASSLLAGFTSLAMQGTSG